MKWVPQSSSKNSTYQFLFQVLIFIVDQGDLLKVLLIPNTFCTHSVSFVGLSFSRFPQICHSELSITGPAELALSTTEVQGDFKK